MTNDVIYYYDTIYLVSYDKGLTDRTATSTDLSNY